MGLRLAGFFFTAQTEQTEMAGRHSGRRSTRNVRPVMKLTKVSENFFSCNKSDNKLGMKSFFYHEEILFSPPDPSVSNRSLGRSPRQSA